MDTGRPSLCCSILATLLIGCSTEVPKSSRLDSSGLTVVTHSDAMMLARPVRTLAAGARDYAYVGPVEINRMGKREYFFWVGLASTVDRELNGLTPDDAVALALVIDDEPMVLPLVEWDTDLDLPPYEATAPIYATLAAPTSLDQIHRIATAESVELHIIPDTNDSASYETELGTSASTRHGTQYRAWHGDWTTWSAFPSED